MIQEGKFKVIKTSLMSKVFILFSGLLIIACQTKSGKVLSDSGVAQVQTEDTEMNQAISKSRQTFDGFLAALTSDDTSNSGFAVKYPFKQDVQPTSGPVSNEHIWLSPVIIQGDKICGIINNQPEYTDKVKMGDTVYIDRSLISDWNYTHKGRLMGGYSIRLLVSRMTAEEKADFQAQTGIVFGE
jgi:uncharacterized protein YegJ (DUF2314 family)